MWLLNYHKLFRNTNLLSTLEKVPRLQLCFYRNTKIIEAGAVDRAGQNLFTGAVGAGYLYLHFYL